MVPDAVLLIRNKKENSTTLAPGASVWSSKKRDGTFYVSKVDLYRCAEPCSRPEKWIDPINIKRENVQLYDVSQVTCRLSPHLCVTTDLGKENNNTLEYGGFTVHLSNRLVLDVSLEDGNEMAKENASMKRFKMVSFSAPQTKLLSSYVSKTKNDEFSQWCDPNQGQYAYDFVIDERDDRILFLRFYVTFFHDDSRPVLISQEMWV